MPLCVRILVPALLALGPVAHGQTIQLPSFSSFGVETTVLVPDGGTAFLGGAGRGDATFGQFGAPPWLRQHGIGMSRASSGVTAHAVIHDLDAMDNALLRKAAGKYGWRRPPGETSSTATSVFGSAPAAAGAPSLSHIQHRKRLHDASREQEARALLQRADQSLRDGKPGIAEIYLRMAASRAPGELQAQRTDIATRLRAARPAVRQTPP